MHGTWSRMHGTWHRMHGTWRCIPGAPTSRCLRCLAAKPTQKAPHSSASTSSDARRHSLAAALRGHLPAAACLARLPGTRSPHRRHANRGSRVFLVGGASARHASKSSPCACRCSAWRRCGCHGVRSRLLLCSASSCGALRRCCRLQSRQCEARTSEMRSLHPDPQARVGLARTLFRHFSSPS
jgi:hypothetical protein